MHCHIAAYSAESSAGHSITPTEHGCAAAQHFQNLCQSKYALCPDPNPTRRWRRSCRATWRRCDALRRAYLRACCWHPPRRACPARPAACRAGIAVRRLSTASTWPKPAGVPMSCALLVFSTHYEAMGAACGPKDSEYWTWRVPAGAPWPALRAAWRTKTALGNSGAKVELARRGGACRRLPCLLRLR